MSTNKPLLIITTGRPASGKSTIAKWLSEELGIPCASKDGIREVLFDGLGWQDRKWAQLLGRTSIDLMFYFAERQLEIGSSLILDNAFDPSASTPRFQALKEKYRAQVIQIVCDSDSETLFKRFRERAKAGSRHPGHGDNAVLDELRANLAKEQSPIMDIGGPVVEVDTTDFAKIDYKEILLEIRAVMPRTKCTDRAEKS